MPRRPTRTVPTALLTGPQSEGAWPAWLAAQLKAAGRDVRQLRIDAGEPKPDDLTDLVQDWPQDGFDVVAHGWGCLLWLRHVAAGAPGPRPARVALVAPPSATEAPDGLAAFYPVPLDIDAVRRAADGTVLVGSDNDPACPAGVALDYGAPLKMATSVLPGAGGLTAADGFAEWSAVLDWCGRDNLAFRV
ncbi:MAG TPA: alpha/beta hydrolase [Jatrophihabitans sp.]|nr:alpha/beta hydrolase [Jatrophihabitans sp.]